MLIGLVGKKQVGKDTVADYLHKAHFFEKIAFAKPIKEACALLFQLDPECFDDGQLKEILDPRHDLSPRQMLQLVGTEMFRKMVNKDFWINYFLKWYDQNKTKNMVVSDIRFQNELDIVKSLGGTIIKIERNNEDNDSHISETGIDSLSGIDFVIENNSTLKTLFSKLEKSLH